MHHDNLPKLNELRDFPRYIFATACTDSMTSETQAISYLSTALAIKSELIQLWINDKPAPRQPTRAEALAAWQCSARYHQCTAIGAFNDARMQAGIARSAKERLATTEAALRDTLAELDRMKREASTGQRQAANDPFINTPSACTPDTHRHSQLLYIRA